MPGSAQREYTNIHNCVLGQSNFAAGARGQRDVVPPGPAQVTTLWVSVVQPQQDAKNAGDVVYSIRGDVLVTCRSCVILLHDAILPNHYHHVQHLSESVHPPPSFPFHDISTYS